MATKADLLKEIEILKEKLNEAYSININLINEKATMTENINQLLEELENVRNNKCAKNERGAGRKTKFKNEQVEECKRLRAEGKTIKEISEIYKCGTATVNRILKR